MPSNIRWPSVAALAVVQIGICIMVWLKVEPTTFGAATAFGAAVLGLMHRIYQPEIPVPPDVPSDVDGAVAKHPKIPPPLPIILLMVGLLSVGCSTFTRQEVASITADAAACILANIDLPNEQITAKCGIAVADRVVLDVLLAEARSQIEKAKEAQAAEFQKRMAACNAPVGAK